MSLDRLKRLLGEEPAKMEAIKPFPTTVKMAKGGEPKKNKDEPRSLLGRAYDIYQEKVGEPVAAVVGGGARGYLGLDKPSYGGQLGEEAYRTGQALGNMPAIGAPAGALSAATKAVSHAPALIGDLLHMFKTNPEAALAITAYHGSPYRFNRFDASKIGSGEGAQAYGHGLYFAGSPDTAKYYSKTLGDWDFKYASPEARQQLKSATDYADGAWSGLRSALTYADGDKNKAAGILSSQYQSGTKDEEMRAAYRLMAQMLRDGRLMPTHTGRFYTVDIPDEMVGKMIDWEKPLSQQPQPVQSALQSSGIIGDVKNVGKVSADKIRLLAQQPNVAEWARRDLLKDAAQIENSKSPQHVAGVLKRMQMEYGITPDHGPFANVANSFLDFVQGMQAVPNMDTGGGALSYLEAIYGPVKAAQKLREAGIPGVRYLDQGSRTAGEGTRNIVVFPGEEEAVKILNIE